MARKKLRPKSTAPERTIEEQRRHDIRRRLKREQRAEREIHALIGKLMRATYGRQQRLLQLASAIVGKDFKIVPVAGQTLVEEKSRVPATV